MSSPRRRPRRAAPKLGPWTDARFEYRGRPARRRRRRGRRARRRGRGRRRRRRRARRAPHRGLRARRRRRAPRRAPALHRRPRHGGRLPPPRGAGARVPDGATRRRLPRPRAPAPARVHAALRRGRARAPDRADRHAPDRPAAVAHRRLPDRRLRPNGAARAAPALRAMSAGARTEGLAIGIDDVRAAAERLRGVAHRTPVLTSRTLDERCSGRVFLKAENLQRIGAFKFRGAWNAISALAPERGVVTASSGNHAQAVALAAALQGTPAVILMPKDAPPSKRAATEGYGAEVLEFDRYADDREALVRELARER